MEPNVDEAKTLIKKTIFGLVGALPNGVAHTLVTDEIKSF